MKHSYLTQEKVVHALSKKAITESEANRLLNVIKTYAKLGQKVLRS